MIKTKKEDRDERKKEEKRKDDSKDDDETEEDNNQDEYDPMEAEEAEEEEDGMCASDTLSAIEWTIYFLFFEFLTFFLVLLCSRHWPIAQVDFS